MEEHSTVTCTACQVRLVGSDARREHYRSDLHRVNLKRKVGGLGPLSVEELASRVAAMESERVSAQRQRETQFCTACSKKFASARALDNHERSRRHLDRMRQLGAVDGQLSSVGGSDFGTDDNAPAHGADDGAEDDEAVEKELARRLAETRGLSATECVFDGAMLSSVEENLRYMGKEFGFFVPYGEAVVDKQGLLTYLGQKVGIGYACVECDRGFGDVAAAQRHMRDRGHCRMTADEEAWMEEYAEFYEFGEGEDGWEEVEGEEATALDGALVEVRAEGEPADVAENALAEEVGLSLGGGKVVGHRSLRRYYRQGAGAAVDERAAVVANREMKELRLLAWAGARRDGAVERGQKFHARRQMRFHLVVGGQNYYTRKARFKQSMAVFNSGHRA